MIRFDPGIGALLALPEEYNVQDKKEEEDGKKKKKTSKHNALWHHNKPLHEHESYQQSRKVQAVCVHISKALGETSNDNAAGKRNQYRGNDDSLFAKHFSPALTHTVRITSTPNWMEGATSGATAPSIVQSHVFTHADSEPGQVCRYVLIHKKMVAFR